MSAHKSIDRICVAIVALTIAVAFIFCGSKAFGIQTTARAIGYENRLFDKSRVHTLDIVIDDWDSFISTCESEEYSPCNVVIDGEAVRNVGIRGKGNTSLSSVKNMDSERYSFKIEFDQYDSTKSYHGLDKLCLNNIIQDNTYMKDYLAYTLMYDFGVNAPLCSYVYITVNGEDWGLYLAVEAIEDSFLTRNYGSNYGDLYKPDAMGFGGGRGNGKDFSMTDFMEENSDDTEDTTNAETEQSESKGGRPDFGGNMPDMGGEMPSDFDPSQFGGGEMPTDFDPSQMFGGDGEKSGFGGGMPNMGGGGFGMGSSDVKLQYIDDDADSYSNIFNNAKTTVNTADQNRLIRSLKALSEQSDIESTVNVEEVIRYFVVHDFLCNGDSYTGQMIHNYYLYEEDGQLSMIPWDYNLAYGSFMGGMGSSSVNSPIDTPVSGGMSDRPMIAWIFDSEEYTEQYHELFGEFLDSVDLAQLVSDTAALIDEYVEKDPTKFCTYDEFKAGVEAISKFCTLRAESVSGQLDGTIPSTTEGQQADSSALVDDSDLNSSDMGSMGGGGGFGGFGGGQRGGRSDRTNKSDKAESIDKSDKSEKAESPDKTEKSESSDDKLTLDKSGLSVKSLSNFTISDTDDSKSARGGRPPQGGGFGGGDFDPNNMPTPPEGFDPDNMPEGFGGGGFDPNNMPEDFDPSNIPDGTAPAEKPAESGTVTTTADGTSSATVSGSAPRREQSTTNAAEQDSTRQTRPQMGSFPSMDGAKPQKDPMVLVLLGASAAVLLAGLGFAVILRR
ncbi:MAG: CotH kinase family protein [Ruminococcus sp.]|nr:CotH kinase family protein [Ruminococcus sp.]